MLIDTALMDRVMGPFSALWRYGSLTSELAKRDVQSRYKGASFGLLWSLISPFLMLCVYSLAFGVLLKSNWPQKNGYQHHFSVIIFVGLIVHGFFAECLARAPTVITGHPSFVKKVVFPLEILSWQVMLSGLFQAGMNILVFIVLSLLLEGHVSWMIVLLPVVFIPLIFMSLGVCWIFSALGVYLRDINQMMGVITMTMLFLSSAMIPVDTLSDSKRMLFHLNPMTFLIDQARAVALWGEYPDWVGLAEYTVGSLVLMYAGYAWFMATKKGFADVL